jgi:ribosome-binding factor A
MSHRKNHRHVRRSHGQLFSINPQLTSSLEQGDFQPTDFNFHRLEHVLLEAIASILETEVSDPHLQSVWPVAIELNADSSCARVTYVVRGQQSQVTSAIERQSQTAFKRAAGFVRTRLALTLNRARTPNLTFVFLGCVDNVMSGVESEEGAP